MRERRTSLCSLVRTVQDTVDGVSPKWQQTDEGSDWALPSLSMNANRQVQNDKGETSETMNQHERLSPVEVLTHMPALRHGLADIDRDRLREFVEPIWDALEGLDAVQLLSLERVPDGAQLRPGTQVRPIHDLVTPLKPEYRHCSCVRYLHVAEVPEKYSIGIFVFPPNNRIPLHDHPGMCVLSRVLYGSVERLSLDLERTPGTESTPSRRLLSMFGMGGHRRPPNARRALRNQSDRLEAPAVTMLYPFEGNLHEFVAGPNGAAVLDVLLPPYDSRKERDCTFYNIEDDLESNDPSACWIIPTGQPENFHCLSGRYMDFGED